MADPGLNQAPPSLVPVGTWGPKDVPVTVAEPWYKFFVNLASVLQNIVGGVIGFTLDNSVTAAGTTQGTAAQLSTEWSVVTTTPLNSGVVVSAFGPGAASTVFNRGANPLRVYPPSGGQIDTLGVNVSYVLASNKVQVFNQTGPTQWQSLQLG